MYEKLLFSCNSSWCHSAWYPREWKNQLLQLQKSIVINIRVFPKRISFNYPSGNKYNVIVIQNVFPYLPLGRYLTTLNRYQTGDGIFFFPLFRNIPIVRYRGSLVTILLLSQLSEFNEFREAHLGKTQLVQLIVYPVTRAHMQRSSTIASNSNYSFISAIHIFKSNW